MMESRTKFGILLGLAILSVVSWMHSMRYSESFRSWFPNVTATFDVVFVATPIVLFVGFYLLVAAIVKFRLPSLIIALVPTIVISVFLFT